MPIAVFLLSIQAAIVYQRLLLFVFVVYTCSYYLSPPIAVCFCCQYSQLLFVNAYCCLFLLSIKAAIICQCLLLFVFAVNTGSYYLSTPIAVYFCCQYMRLLFVNAYCCLFFCQYRRLLFVNAYCCLFLLSIHAAIICHRLLLFVFAVNTASYYLSMHIAVCFCCQ